MVCFFSFGLCFSAALIPFCCALPSASSMLYAFSDPAVSSPLPPSLAVRVSPPPCAPAFAASPPFCASAGAVRTSWDSAASRPSVPLSPALAASVPPSPAPPSFWQLSFSTRIACTMCLHILLEGQLHLLSPRGKRTVTDSSPTVMEASSAMAPMLAGTSSLSL